MSLQDVVFLPFRASFSNTFYKNCHRCESLGTPTCPKTEFGGKQVHTPSKMLLLKEISFLCEANLLEVIGLLTKMR